MYKRVLVGLLVLLMLVVSSYAEEITFETLIHNDVWWKTEQGQSKPFYCVFNLDGTGIANGSPFMWERTIFGIEITNAPESFAVSGRYNLIETSGVPGLQPADNHGVVYIRSADLATALNLTPSPTPAAKAEDNIIPGIKDMVLLERNQIKIFFSGNYLDTNFLGVEIIIENNSDYDIVLGYTGQVNGWSIHNSSMGTTVKSHSKAKEYLFFDPKEIDVTTAKDIESVDLKLIVKDAAAKQQVIFEAETGYLDFKGGNTVSKAASEEPPVREYALGETVATDMMEFVLSGFDCVYYLHPKSYAEKDDMAGGAVGPGTDMTFANPEFQVKNVGKESLSIAADILFTIDYNNGYQYTMKDSNICYLVDSRAVGGKVTATSWVSFKLPPLSTSRYEAYIPATALVDTDVAAPVRVIVQLKSTQGVQEFIYRVR